MIIDRKKLDGGLSTALELRGNKLTTRLWSGELLRTAPAEIEGAHRDYIEAGAEIIITSAYQVSFMGCTERGWSEEETVDALKLSTQLAQQSIAKSKTNHEVWVAASVGPYGAALADGSEYHGKYGISKSKLRDFHGKRLDILIDSKPDLLALETMPDLDEVEVLLDLINESGSVLPFWVSYSCQENLQTNAGQKFSDAVALVSSHPNAVAVGVNCTAPHLITDLLRSTKATIAFVVYPNAGKTWDAVNKKWSDENSAEFSESLINQWRHCGAKIIGGCCGVGPKEIAKINLQSI